MLDLSKSKSHRDTICKLIFFYDWTYGAELGLGSGHLSKKILSSFPDFHLVGVDILRRPHRVAKIRALQDEYGSRYSLYGMTTEKASNFFEDRIFDFIFIDAGHSYQAVKSDIKNWSNKVKPGGMILGHDYGHKKYTGVAKAVDEYFGNKVTLMGHGIWAVQN